MSLSHVPSGRPGVLRIHVRRRQNEDDEKDCITEHTEVHEVTNCNGLLVSIN